MKQSKVSRNPKNITRIYTKRECQIKVTRMPKTGYQCELVEPGTITSFKDIVNDILDDHLFQYIIFLIKNLTPRYLEQLKRIGFQLSRGHFFFQEKPDIGEKVFIAIKPYTGTHATGKVQRILTGAPSHPRGFKVMLVDGTVGRLEVKKDYIKINKN